MERWQRLLAGAFGVGFWLVYLASGIDKAKSVVEAPGTVARFLGYVRNMFDFTLGALVFLLAGAVCLAVALWRPAYTQFFLSRLPSTLRQSPWLPSAGGATAMPKNVLHNTGSNTAFSNVHVGDVHHAPAPELRELGRENTALPDGTHETKIAIFVPHAVPAITVQAQAEGIVRAHIIGVRMMVSQSANANAWTESWGPAHGRYDFHVITKERVQVGLAHTFRDVHRP